MVPFLPQNELRPVANTGAAAPFGGGGGATAATGNITQRTIQFHQGGQRNVRSMAIVGANDNRSTQSKASAYFQSCQVSAKQSKCRPLVCLRSTQTHNRCHCITRQSKMSVWLRMEIAPEAVETTKLLGRGSYAKVFRGRALGMDCAVKMYYRNTTQAQPNLPVKEIQLMASLDHPCTVRLLYWVRNPLQMITELCRGDLTAFYQSKIEGCEYTEVEALRLLKVGLAVRALTFSHN